MSLTEPAKVFRVHTAVHSLTTTPPNQALQALIQAPCCPVAARARGAQLLELSQITTQLHAGHLLRAGPMLARVLGRCAHDARRRSSDSQAARSALCSRTSRRSQPQLLARACGVGVSGRHEAPHATARQCNYTSPLTEGVPVRRAKEPQALLTMWRYYTDTAVL